MPEVHESKRWDKSDRDSMHKRVLGLQTLLELSRSLVSVQEARRLDGLVLLTVMGLLSVSRAILLTCQAGEDRFRLYARGIPNDLFPEEESFLRPSGVFARRIKAARGITEVRSDGLPARETELVEKLSGQKITQVAAIRAQGELRGILLLGQRMDAKDIQEFDEEMLMSILDLAGIVIHNVQLYEGLKQANTSLADSNQRLQELDTLKNEFLSNVGHELRTPLTCILGFAQCLSYSNVNEEMRQDFSNNIMRQSQKLSNLINQILDLSEISQKHLQFEKQKGNLNDLILEVVETMQIEIEEKEIRLEMALEPGMQESWFDPMKTRRVLLNLLDNAIKFTDNAGMIRLTSSCSDSEIVCTVEDSGIGIPKDQIDTIFEEFRQGDGSGTRTHGGSGIGLSLAKHIVEAQDGSIQVASEVGKGSQFTVALPRDRQETEDPSQGDPQLLSS